MYAIQMVYKYRDAYYDVVDNGVKTKNRKSCTLLLLLLLYIQVLHSLLR